MQTDYSTVFQLAKDKGFPVGQSQGYLGFGIYKNKPNRILMEFALIQKWLRDEHKIDIELGVARYDEKTTYYQYRIDGLNLDKVYSSSARMLYGYPSYEEALLNGIHEALKLI